MHKVLICPGAQKAATTFLYNLLKQHSKIYFPNVKEVHFFDQDYKKGKEWYLDTYYNNIGSNINYIADFTPEYMIDKDIPQKIFNTFGEEIKFVIMLRNPSERAFSQYRMYYKQGYESRKFSEIIDGYIKGNKEDNKYNSCINRGFYNDQVLRFYKYFSRENIKIVLFEEFVENEEKITKEILNFLELENEENINYNVNINTSNNTVPMYPKIVGFLRIINAKKIANTFVPRNIKTKIIRLLNNTLLKQKQSDKNKLALTQTDKNILNNIYKADIYKLEKTINKSLAFWLR